MSVEECCDGYFAAAEFLGDAFEREGFRGLGLEESLGGGGEAVDERCLCNSQLLASFTGIQRFVALLLRW